MATSFTYPYSIDNSESYKEILKYLNDKIDAVKKHVSYFDFYNITNAVTDTNNFAAQINSLPLNEALVVNTSPFYYSGENYSTGDIIIKNNTGGIHHIKAQTGGVYFPELIKLETDGNYSITYTFADSMPTLDNSRVTLGQSAELAEKITFTNLQAEDASETNIYGEWGSFQYYEEVDPSLYKESGAEFYTNKWLFAVEAVKCNNEYIRPFVQFFMCESGVPVETVYLDYQLVLDSNNFITPCWVVIPIYNDESIGNIYVKVK